MSETTVMPIDPVTNSGDTDVTAKPAEGGEVKDKAKDATKNDEALYGAFDRLLGANPKAESDDQPTPDPDDANAEPAEPKDEDQPPEPPEDGEAKDEPKAKAEPAKANQAKPEPAKPDEKVHAKRVNALKRAQYPDDVIAGLPPERIAQLGDKLLAQQAEQDRAGNELARVRQVLAQIEAEKKTQPAKPESTPAAASADTEGAEAADPLEASLAEWDPELGKTIKGIIGKEIGKHQKQVEEVTKERDQLLKMLRTQVLTSTRSQLLGDLPQLADPEIFSKVTKRMGELEKLESYQTEEGIDYTMLMRDAALVTLGPSSINTERTEAAKNRARVQAQGQLTSTRDRGGPKRGPTTDDERLGAVFDMLKNKGAE